MKLNDLDKKEFANQALKETYKIDFNISNMSMPATKNMLNKVRSLALEARDKDTTNPAYMKLVFMEEALVNHYNKLAANRPKIVVENEKIEESQVYLAAQSMVDEINKMIKTVGQMQVEELPALVDSIESEIGVNESQTFQEQVSATLDQLSATLKENQTTLKNAVNQLTGEGGEGFAAGAEAGADMGAGAEMPGAEAGADMGTDIAAAGAEAAGVSPEAPEEEPAAEPLGGAGRAKR